MSIFSHVLFNKLLYNHFKKGTIPELAQLLAVRYTDTLCRRTGINTHVVKDEFLRLVTYLLEQMDIEHKRIEQTGWLGMKADSRWNNKEIKINNSKEMDNSPSGTLIDHCENHRGDAQGNEQNIMVERDVSRDKLYNATISEQNKTPANRELEYSMVIAPYYPSLILHPPSTLNTPAFPLFLSELLIHITHLVGWSCICKVIEGEQGLIVIVCADMDEDK